MEKDLLRLLQACVGVVVLLGTAILVFTLFPTMNSDVAAAWVQAVGSILAIGVAIWIPQRHASLERKRQLKLAKEESDRQVVLLATGMELAEDILQAIAKDLGDMGIIFDYDTAVRRIHSCLAVLERVEVKALTALQVEKYADTIKGCSAVIDALQRHPAYDGQPGVREQKSSTIQGLVNEIRRDRMAL